MHQDARYERISEFRTEVESFVQQVARYARKNTSQKPPHFIPHRGEIIRASKCTRQYGITLRVEKTRGWANVKQCKLKVWGVAVVDLWLFFEYHAEVKV